MGESFMPFTPVRIVTMFAWLPVRVLQYPSYERKMACWLNSYRNLGRSRQRIYRLIASYHINTLSVCLFFHHQSRSADDDKENCALDNSPELDKTKGQLSFRSLALSFMPIWLSVQHDGRKKNKNKLTFFFVLLFHQVAFHRTVRSHWNAQKRWRVSLIWSAWNRREGPMKW